ncbi:MAG: hypothetical protein ACXVGG_13885 [Mycobacteriaceae bacterium]
MRKTRFRLWLALAGAIVLAVFCALIALGAVINIFSAGRGETSLAGGITLAALSGAVVIACAGWTVHVGHRLRTGEMGDHGAAASQLADGGRHPAGRPAPLGPRPRRPRPRVYRRRVGPVGMTVWTLLFTLPALGMAVLAVHWHLFSHWRLSEYVQAHGELVGATVVSVHNNQHMNKRIWYSPEIAILLHRPVHGTTTAIAHVPDGNRPSQLVPGETVIVRVDPQRPSYAEFPGKPSQTLGGLIWWALWEAFLLLLAGSQWFNLVVRIRSWIRQRYRPASMFSPNGTSP